MQCQLHELSAERRPELADELVEGLRSSTATSYRELQPTELHGRAWRLVDSFVTSLVETPDHFIRHVEAIVSDRIASGFALAEVQVALSLLEERLWRLVVTECDVQEHAPNLARVTTTIGAAKDRLAQLYLAEVQRQQARAACFERRLDALFRGTAEGHGGEDS